MKSAIAENPGTAASMFAISLIAIAITSPFVLATAYWYGKSIPVARYNSDVFVLSVVIVPFLVASNAASHVLISLGKRLHGVTIFASEKLAYIVVLSVLLALGRVTPFSIIAVYTSAILCRFVFGTAFVSRHIRRPTSWSEVIATYRKTRGVILASYGGSLIYYYVAVAPTLVLGATSGTELKHFAVAKSLIDYGLLIPMLFAIYAPPRFVQTESHHLTTEITPAIVLTAVAIMLAIMTPFLVFPDLVLSILLGARLDQSAACLRVMSIGLFASGLINLFHSVITRHNLSHRLMAQSCISGVVMTVLLIVCHSQLDALNVSYIFSTTHVIALIAFLVCGTRRNR